MLKIILFGDSITAGYENGLTDFRLNELLESQNPDIKTINAGIPGDTTEGALKRVDAHVLKYQPDIVTVFFGANDVATYSGITKELYETNLRELIARIGEEKVILIGPPFARQGHYEALERPLINIEEFNQKVQIIAEEKGVSYINLLEVMLEKEAEHYLQSDGLHFSMAGYQLLGDLIHEKIKEKKKER